MNVFKLFVVACLLGAVLAAEPKWSQCSIGSDKPSFVPEKVDLTPLPGVADGDLVFKITGKNEDHIVEGGSFEVIVYDVVHVFGRDMPVKVYSEVKSICDRTPCPIATGAVEFTYVKHLPKYTPKGDYHIKLVAKELETDKLLLCMGVDFPIKSASSALKMPRKAVVVS